MTERIDNGVFFGTHEPRTEEANVPEAVFYAGRPRPAAEVTPAERASATPLRFGTVLFLVGWAGILFQAQFFQQVVIGAPLFEELAKLGPALVIVALLGARSLWIRLPLALAFGAGFGVFEHFVTYPEEPLHTFVSRILFHAASPALSMLVYGAFEDLPDTSMRWAATLPATLFHWANNFAALAFAVLALGVPGPVEAVASGWSGLIVLAMIALLVYGTIARERFEERCRAILREMIPRLALTPTGETTPAR